MVDDIVLLESVVSELQLSLAGRQDNRGAGFKVNVDAKWGGTVAIRCNHVNVDGVSIHLQRFIQSLQVAQKIDWWEHSSIARCWTYMRSTNEKHAAPTRRMLYLTLRPPDELYTALVNEWDDGKFYPLDELSGWLCRRINDGR